MYALKEERGNIKLNMNELMKIADMFYAYSYAIPTR